MTQKQKLQLFSLLSTYPLLSTFVMTLIWQITQNYLPPFFGVYYFKWVFLYSEYNEDWLSENYLAATRWLYFIYLSSFVILTILTLLVLFRRNGKAVCIWAICGLWIADSVWIVLDIINSANGWQMYFLLAEHLIFLIWAGVFSVYYLKLKREFPELFKKRKRNQYQYRTRF